MGRPPIGKKAATLFAIRLPDEIANGIKAYAKANGIKTKGAAIRRMIDVALEHEALKDLTKRIDGHAERTGETRLEVMRRVIEAGLVAETSSQRRTKK